MYKKNVNIFYATQLLHSLVFTIPIWIVYYQARISVIEISALVTIQYITQVVLELPSGALADMLGRRKTLMLGFFTAAISMLFFLLASHFYHFIILALIIGASDSFRSGSEEALVYDTHKQANKLKIYDQVYAKGGVYYQVGLVIATALGGFFFDINQFLPYLAYGVSLTIGTILTYFYTEPSIDSETFTLKNYVKQMKDGTKEVFKHQYATLLSLFYIFAGGIAWTSTLYFNAYMMVDLVPQDSVRGIIIAALRLINVVFIASILKNSKLFTWKRTVLFFPIIMLVGYLPGFMLSGIWGIPFVQAVMIATTARWIVLSPRINEIFSSKVRATAISVLSLLIGIIYIAITGVSGVIIQSFGIKVMHTLLGILTLLTVVPISIKLLKIDRTKYIPAQN